MMIATMNRVANRRFLKSNKSNDQPMTYPGATNINEKSRKASIEPEKSCRVKLIMDACCWREMSETRIERIVADRFRSGPEAGASLEINSFFFDNKGSPYDLSVNRSNIFTHNAEKNQLN